MSRSITSIEGIGPVYGQRLGNLGIRSVSGLLLRGATRKARKELAEASGIEESKILSFVNMADLFRIKGVCSQFAELLQTAGVDTVKELSTRNPENLFRTLAETNEDKKLTHIVPNLNQVKDFIEQAQKLAPAISY